MKYYFCTLFDRNYLYKGLALYHSLLQHCPDFTLWILCMDDLSFKILREMSLEKAVLISTSDFEDEELKKVKPTRTVAEYCWTCTPSLPLYLLKENPTLDMITYLDADLFFYSDPTPIFEELGDRSIMIIEHRFPDHLKHLEANGIYNVQMVTFRNDFFGLECLEWWRERCNEWCYYRLEDGKLGDQKYLDDWPVRFQGVHVLEYKGAGVALWNIMRYKTTKREGKPFIDDVPLIFYHFHQFSMLKSGSYDFGNKGIYSLTDENIECIYKPYIAEFERSITMVREVDHHFKYGFKDIRMNFLLSRLLSIPLRIRGWMITKYRKFT
jgi:hypothetical protein